MKMNLLEPLTHEDVYKLKPGDWIWDNKFVERRVHRRSLFDEKMMEPIGFRLVHILDLEAFTRYSNKPFMLSNIDQYMRSYSWEPFIEGRYFKIREEQK
jgi:hypothetical protein